MNFCLHEVEQDHTGSGQLLQDQACDCTGHLHVQGNLKVASQPCGKAD